MKKFLTKISFTVLPVWLLLVGMATYLWVTDDNSGDLMRLGLIDSGPEYSDSIKAGLLPMVYYKGQNNDSLLRRDTCNVLVIGDSFSHGGGVGKIGDYVNYLAYDSQRHVVVYTPADPTLASPIQVAYDVLKLGVIDSTNVKNLVVQEVERYLLERHGAFVTTHKSLPRPVIKDAEDDKPAKKDVSPLLRVKDYVFYHFFGANPICKVKLSQPAFGGKEPDMLYFYNEDVQRGLHIDEAARERVLKPYRAVIDLARERGVNLVLLVACDKYDLYQDDIVDNPYPTKTVNEDLARWMAAKGLPDCVVFSKQVLRPLVEQGVRDVYLFNDTHWSPASSRLIAAEVIARLK